MPLHLLVAETGPKGRALSRASAARREAAEGPGQGPPRRPPGPRALRFLGRQGTGSTSLALARVLDRLRAGARRSDIAEPLRSPRRRCRRGGSDENAQLELLSSFRCRSRRSRPRRPRRCPPWREAARAKVPERGPAARARGPQRPSGRTARALSAAPQGAAFEGMPGAGLRGRAKAEQWCAQGRRRPRSPRDGPLAARACREAEAELPQAVRIPTPAGGERSQLVRPQGAPCAPRRREARPLRCAARDMADSGPPKCTGGKRPGPDAVARRDPRELPSAAVTRPGRDARGVTGGRPGGARPARRSQRVRLDRAPPEPPAGCPFVLWCSARPGATRDVVQRFLKPRAGGGQSCGGGGGKTASDVRAARVSTNAARWLNVAISRCDSLNGRYGRSRVHAWPTKSCVPGSCRGSPSRFPPGS